MIKKKVIKKVKSRRLAVKFIERQFAEPSFMKGMYWHYGKAAVRQLLDYIYDGEPKNKNEYLLRANINKKGKDNGKKD
jgi:hypothetical protein